MYISADCRSNLLDMIFTFGMIFLGPRWDFTDWSIQYGLSNKHGLTSQFHLELEFFGVFIHTTYHTSHHLWFVVAFHVHSEKSSFQPAWYDFQFFDDVLGLETRFYKLEISVWAFQQRRSHVPVPPQTHIFRIAYTHYISQSSPSVIYSSFSRTLCKFVVPFCST